MDPVGQIKVDICDRLQKARFAPIGGMDLSDYAALRLKEKPEMGAFLANSSLIVGRPEDGKAYLCLALYDAANAGDKATADNSRIGLFKAETGRAGTSMSFLADMSVADYATGTATSRPLQQIIGPYGFNLRGLTRE